MWARLKKGPAIAGPPGFDKMLNQNLAA